MNNKLIIIFIGFIAFFSSGCNRSENCEIIGKWQSLNNSAVVVEFSNDKKVDLFREGKPMWSMAAKNGELTYTLIKLSENWLQLKILDGDEIYIKGKIEVLDKDRIRIYYFKHHDILDLADEYHRTEDFNSFSKIMKKIMEEPDTVYFKK